MEMTANSLVESNLALVGFTINKYFNRSYTEHNPLYDHEDLMQIGSIGLINAARSYDETKGAFSTYAVTAIRNAIAVAFRYQANHETIDDFSTRSSIDDIVEEGVDFSAEQLDLYDCIEKLTEGMPKETKKCAEVLFNYLAMGYSIIEASEKSGMSSSKAYHIVRAARLNAAAA